MRRLGFAAALMLALTACSEEQAESLPSTTGFYFPIGLATTRIAGGGTPKTALLVSSTNFDLRYSGAEGGTLVSVSGTDPKSAPAVSTVWTWAGYERIASYAGPVAVADMGTCSDGSTALASARALVASRYDDRIYLFDVANDDGALTVAAIRNAPDGFDDPFAVTVACSATKPRAFVAYLDPPDSSRGTGPGAWIGELNLRSGVWIRHVELGDGPVRAMAYDATHDRLWATTQSEGNRALLHMVNLADAAAWNGSDPRTAVTTYDLDFDPNAAPVAGVIRVASVRGAELGSIAVGAGRLYIGTRLYDVEGQASLGRRPSGDVGGELIVLDVVEGAVGSPPQLAVRAIADIGIGVAGVAVVKGATSDVAVVSSRDQDRLFYYDDATLSHGELFGENSLGVPDVGDRPIALTVDQTPLSGGPWVYVASFGDHVVRRFRLDTDFPFAHAALEEVHP